MKILLGHSTIENTCVTLNEMILLNYARCPFMGAPIIHHHAYTHVLEECYIHATRHAPTPPLPYFSIALTHTLPPSLTLSLTIRKTFLSLYFPIRTTNHTNLLHIYECYSNAQNIDRVTKYRKKSPINSKHHNKGLLSYTNHLHRSVHSGTVTYYDVTEVPNAQFMIWQPCP